MKENVVKAAAFTDCVYISFADRVCSLPGPINNTVKPTVKGASSGLKKKTVLCLSSSAPSYQVYDLHFFRWGSGGGVI